MIAAHYHAGRFAECRFVPWGLRGSQISSRICDSIPAKWYLLLPQRVDVPGDPGMSREKPHTLPQKKVVDCEAHKHSGGDAAGAFLLFSDVPWWEYYPCEYGQRKRLLRHIIRFDVQKFSTFRLRPTLSPSWWRHYHRGEKRYAIFFPYTDWVSPIRIG